MVLALLLAGHAAGIILSDNEPQTNDHIQKGSWCVVWVSWYCVTLWIVYSKFGNEIGLWSIQFKFKFNGSLGIRDLSSSEVDNISTQMHRIGSFHNGCQMRFGYKILIRV